jgi:predicted amidohydrolase YtcJ
VRANNLFEHIRNICERPGMFAPGFSLEHLHLFIHGYELARRDAKLPSPYTRFEEWLYAQHPEWSPSSQWWAKHLLDACGGDLERTLLEISGLMDRFLTSEGAEPSSKTS